MKKLLGITSLVVIAGCGGDSGTSSTLAPFVNWDTSLKANQTFQVSGMSLEATVATDSNKEVISSVVAEDERFVTITGALNARGDNLSRFAMTSTSGRNLSFSSGIIKENGYIQAESLDQMKTLTMVDPVDVDWKFQSFGRWMNASANFSPNYEGYFSVGAATPASSLPVRTTATYTGIGLVTYAAVGAEPQRFQSNISVIANFETRSLTLESNVVSGSPTQGNFNGVLEYRPSDSLFSGIVRNNAVGLEGKASGRFYGPQYQEIGGVFSLSNTAGPTGAERVFGAFGASR